MCTKIFFFIAVFCSLMSQQTYVLERGLDVWLKMVWFFPSLCLFAERPLALFPTSLRRGWLYLLLFSIFCLFGEAANAPHHYFMSDWGNIFISFFICVISYTFWRKHQSQSVLNQLCIILMIAGLWLSYEVYKSAFVDYDIMERTYAFGQKNSMGQILLCICIITAINYSPKHKYLKWIILSLTLPLLYMVFILKSRATLASLFFVYVYYIVVIKNKKIKWALSILLVILTAYVLFDPQAYAVIVDGIFLGGRDANDLNSVSSGRGDFISDAIKYIPENLWIGVGYYYVDCMPVNILVQYGIVGLTIIMSYIIFVWKKVVALNRTINVNITTYLLFFAFLINSLFEAYPPFGPGVKCFMLWMMLGFSLAHLERSMQYKPYSKSALVAE